MRKIIMKKYLFLIAFCVSSFVHGNGFDNLKNIQNHFHALIYQAGDLGAPQPAPEVPYIAGLLGNQIDSISEDAESRYIYETLYDRSAAGGNRKAIPSIDEAKTDAFDALSFDDFARYNGYKKLGHSVLGVAAQEIADPVSRSPSSLSSSTPSSTLSSASLKPGGDSSAGGSSARMNFGAGSNPFAAGASGLRRKQGTNPSSGVTSVPTPSAAAPQTLLERVHAKLGALRAKQKISKNDKADIAILSELEDELLATGKREKEQQERFDALKEFFKNLEDTDNSKPPITRAVLRSNLKEIALQKFPQQVSPPATPVNGGASGTTSPVFEETVVVLPLLERVTAMLNALTAGVSQTRDIDVFILTQLKGELEVAHAGRSAEEEGRLEKLTKFFGLLEKNPAGITVPTTRKILFLSAKIEPPTDVAAIQQRAQYKLGELQLGSSETKEQDMAILGNFVTQLGHPADAAMDMDNEEFGQFYKFLMLIESVQNPFINSLLRGLRAKLYEEEITLQDVRAELLRRKNPTTQQKQNDKNLIQELEQALLDPSAVSKEQKSKLRKLKELFILLRKEHSLDESNKEKLKNLRLALAPKIGFDSALLAKSMLQRRSVLDDQEDSDDEDNKIDFSALDVNSLGLDELKQKFNEINKEIDRIDDDFGETAELQTKLAEIDKRIRELDPSRGAISQSSAPSTAAASSKRSTSVPVGGGKTTTTAPRLNIVQTGIASSIGLAQSIIQGNQAAGGVGNTPAPGLNIPQRSNQEAGGGGSVATGGAASSERQIIDEMKAIADVGGKYELLIKQYLERLIAGGAEGASERRSYLDNLLVTLGTLKSSEYYMQKFVGVSRNKVGTQIDAIIGEINKENSAQRNIK